MKYYIDFSGWCTVEANSKEEAEQKFWDGLQSPTKNAFDDYYDIEGIESYSIEEK